MINYAVAIVVASPLNLEATFALVDDAQDIAFLQQVCRINGLSEGNKSTASAAPQRLRLALEEMVVGFIKGFLRLESAAIGTDDCSNYQDEGRAFIERISQEVLEGIQCRRITDDSKWRLSSQRRDQLRIFLDLWDKGYTVTFGSKFGANFLIYKVLIADSPKHAHAVALIVIKGYKEEFARVDVVSFCRVAKMVKKQLVFACVRPTEEYVSDGEQIYNTKDNAREDKAETVVYVSLNHALLVSRQKEKDETT